MCRSVCSFTKMHEINKLKCRNDFRRHRSHKYHKTAFTTPPSHLPYSLPLRISPFYPSSSDSITTLYGDERYHVRDDEPSDWSLEILNLHLDDDGVFRCNLVVDGVVKAAEAITLVVLGESFNVPSRRKREPTSSRG